MGQPIDLLHHYSYIQKLASLLDKIARRFSFSTIYLYEIDKRSNSFWLVVAK